VSSRESRVTRVSGQLTDGSRGSRVEKCDPLSSLLLSGVDSILSADMAALQRRYHAAIESRQRVTDAVFVRDLQRLVDIQRHYLNSTASDWRRYGESDASERFQHCGRRTFHESRPTHWLSSCLLLLVTAHVKVCCILPAT